MSRKDTTWAALAKAAAVAFSSPFAKVKETLPGHLSHTGGAHRASPRRQYE